jgi:DNA-directed RNA polymerase sigma subunit (sigma70/sigma32)
VIDKEDSWQDLAGNSPASLEPLDPSEPMEDSVITKLLQDKLAGEMNQVLRSMHPKEARIIHARLGFADESQKTIDQICSEFGVTLERVRQIESKFLSKLRHTSRSENLRATLDEI